MKEIIPAWSLVTTAAGKVPCAAPWQCSHRFARTNRGFRSLTACQAGAVSAAGSAKKNVAPCPGVLGAHARPPCRARIRQPDTGARKPRRCAGAGIPRTSVRNNSCRSRRYQQAQVDSVTVSVCRPRRKNSCRSSIRCAMRSLALPRVCRQRTPRAFKFENTVVGMFLQVGAAAAGMQIVAMHGEIAMNSLRLAVIAAIPGAGCP